MSRRFSLAGLLRLRHLQQDLAAADLAAARRRLDSTAARQQGLRAALADGASEATDIRSLAAIVAARSSVRSTLADLTTLERTQNDDVETADAALTAARRDAISLEKLERKHEDAVIAEELQSEQAALDELAITAWHRDANTDDGGTP